METTLVITKFASRIREGQTPIIYGDDTQTCDFVFVSDIVQANRLALACERDAAIEQIFNIASERDVSPLDLIDALNSC